MSLQELFARKRAARELEADPGNAHTLRMENVRREAEHAHLLKEMEAANVKTEEPEVLDGSMPLYFEILPTQAGVIEVNYSRKRSLNPLRTIGELRHEDLAKALLRLLADAQPHDINIYGGDGNE